MGLLKLNWGLSLIERVGSSDTSDTIAQRFVEQILDQQNLEEPILNIENQDGQLKFWRTDGEELNASIVQAEANLAIDARIITDESGEQFVSIDSTTAVISNLRYIVANDAGQGHGNIRLTVEPDFRTISLNPGRPASIDEDGSLNLEELIVFNGAASAGVDEKLFLTLSSVDGTEGSFILSVNGELRTLDVGTPFSLSLLSLPSAQILQPENFHGSFELKFDLIGSFNDFSSRSTSEVANINVLVAEIAENQAQAKLILAESESDLANCYTSC